MIIFLTWYLKSVVILSLLFTLIMIFFNDRFEKSYLYVFGKPFSKNESVLPISLAFIFFSMIPFLRVWLLFSILLFTFSSTEILDKMKK